MHTFIIILIAGALSIILGALQRRTARIEDENKAFEQFMKDYESKRALDTEIKTLISTTEKGA